MIMTIKEIEKLSPVKIKYAPIMDNGRFYFKAPQYIEIYSRLTGAFRKGIMLHEIGHAVCHANGCRCLKVPNKTLAEYHALRFTMKHVQGDKELIQVFVKQVRGFLNLPHYPHHCMAARRITKLKQWQRFSLTNPQR